MDTSITQFQQLVLKAIEDLAIPSNPASLYEPIRYFLSLPGKRLRPIMVLASLSLYRKPESRDAASAMATELFHNFSLVHDDIMDKADLRRGWATVHKKWDEPTALLAGDSLLIFAYEALIKSNTPDLAELIHRFNQMSKAVCEGQMLDMDFSREKTVTTDQYLDMIDRKTGALIAFSFEMGGFLGNAPKDERDALHDFGLAMGRCFQLRDDYLDLFGDPAQTGKALGGDISNRKLTLPILLSLSSPDDPAFIEIWNESPLENSERVTRALAWMRAQDIPARLEATIDAEFSHGITKLNRVKGDIAGRELILGICKTLAYREK